MVEHKDIEELPENPSPIDVNDIPDTETTFYMTYDGSNSATVAPWIEHQNIPVMKNASNYWKPEEGEWRDPPEWDTRLIIDCGGYSIQLNYGEYPWSIESYNDWLNRNDDRIEWAPPMDYACERRFDDIWHYEERMEKSLENTIEQYEMDRGDWEFVPVLQGRTIRDYVKFYDWLDDHGIPNDRVGLGTVCRLSNTQKIVSVESQLRNRTNVESIHGYGVKIEAFSFGATFESSDSAAWVYPVSFGDYYKYSGNVHDGLERVEGDDEKGSGARRLWTMQSYYRYVKDIIAEQERKRNKQTTAMNW